VTRPQNRSRQTLRILDAFLSDPVLWRHGYDLSKQTDLQSGTLYPILMRLAEQGLLEEGWEAAEVPGRPHRHVYRLTSAGMATARALVHRERGKSGALRPSKAQS